MARPLIVRKSPSSPWVRNFSLLGWKVRSADGKSWIPMHPANTKIRSSDNTKWLEVK